MSKKIHNTYLNPREYIEDENVKLFEVVKEFKKNTPKVASNRPSLLY